MTEKKAKEIEDKNKKLKEVSLHVHVPLINCTCTLNQ